MRSFSLTTLAACLVVATLCPTAAAVRLNTNPSTSAGDPPLQFESIALTPDGATIVASALFDNAGTTNYVYSLTLPANPAGATVDVTQLSPLTFSIEVNYDVAFTPVISPDGQTILYTHDNGAPPGNSIYKLPISGEQFASSFTGLFGGNNLVAPGNGNSFPVYSPSGGTVYFVNEESAFGGSIPDLSGSAGAGNVIGWDDLADWDQLYSVPAAGGTPVAVTQPGDGDIDPGLFALTPDGASFVFAPDNPVAAKINRGEIRPKLYSIPSSGGTRAEIPMPAPAHDFSITNQLTVTPDGQSVLFVGDYLTHGKNELFSVPIAGGTPTRVSDELPFAGDVYAFAVSPDGASVAYAAGQNSSATTELFLTPIAGGVGASIRVSDAPASNSGLFDVASGANAGLNTDDEPEEIATGQILFSSNGEQIYYLGAMDTPEVNDLYVVDLSEKSGLTPSPFYFIGPAGGEFFDESNWEDAQGANPPENSINPGENIRQSLIVDGDSIVATGGEVRFQLGGSLELTPGSQLNMTGANGQLQFFPGSGFKATDASVVAREDIIFAGTTHLDGAQIQSQADDIEFQDKHDTVIIDSTLTADDNLIFDNSATSVFGSTLISQNGISMRYEIDIVLTDTDIELRDDDRLGGISDLFAGPQGEGSTLWLKGESTLTANSIRDGVDLVIDDSSVATMLVSTVKTYDLVGDDGASTITLASADASLVLGHPGSFDARPFIINGLTGLSYQADPTAWNVADWDGLSALPLLKLVGSGGLPGDFNGDGVVDAADYTVWRDNLGLADAALNGNGVGDPSGLVVPADYELWRGNFGASSSIDSAGTAPEPASVAMAMAALLASLATRRRVPHCPERDWK
ncbi:translocation protein TolB [Posidoniimonas corsicana]|uniref:Translocation protein TolB n=1 Tax=Posidoniimonas corsicana TaxID=1938618 RepID=A0A5C5V6P2_9BACT|nr:PD40 domain-containing protein [Posidoniimonas corsicana]TWT33941.1 translocation protein TolB [Posidoniimonas corsicana]